MRTLFVLGLLAAAPAQDGALGCRYRGPGELVPVGLDPAPELGYRGNLVSWEFWWEINRDRFWHEAGERKPTQKDIEERILPALLSALDAGEDAITRASLLALAKIGRKLERPKLRALFLSHLSHRDPRVRECATLAHGIAGMTASIPILDLIANDAEAGRKLAKVPRLDSRIRAFACYALGLIADRSRDLDVKRRVFRKLNALRAKADGDPDVGVASIRAMALLNPSSFPSAVGRRALLDEVVETLRPLVHGPRRGLDTWPHCHLLPTVGGLVGRKRTEYRDELGRALLKLFDGKTSRNVQRSAVIALARIATPSDAEYADALRGYTKNSKDEQTKYLAYVGLGQIGGKQNREFLIHVLENGSKSRDRPWAALALGLLARERRARGGKPDDALRNALLRQMDVVKHPSTRSAIAIALGLARERAAATKLLAFLAKYRSQDVFASYLCSSLALMRAEEAGDEIRDLALRSFRRPHFLFKALPATARIGGAGTTELLTRILDSDEDSLTVLNALAASFAEHRDPAAIDPLIRALRDTKSKPVRRAYAATALGVLADGELPFHWKIAANLDYRAMVTTLSYRGTGILEIQ